jgi:hypothetical protein
LRYTAEIDRLWDRCYGEILKCNLQGLIGLVESQIDTNIARLIDGGIGHFVDLLPIDIQSERRVIGFKRNGVGHAFLETDGAVWHVTPERDDILIAFGRPDLSRGCAIIEEGERVMPAIDSVTSRTESSNDRLPALTLLSRTVTSMLNTKSLAEKSGMDVMTK